MRGQTHAHRKLVDDVPEAVKQRRLREVIDTFNAGARLANDADVGKVHHVLLEGVSKKDPDEFMGRTETNKRVVVRRAPVPRARAVATAADAAPLAEPVPGDYVAVRVTDSLSANTLRAEALSICSITEFAASGEAQWAQM